MSPSLIAAPGKTALAAAVAQTELEPGTLEIVLNAAGVANANPAEAVEEAPYQTLMDINMKEVFLSSQAEASAMLKDGKGSIGNTASMSGVIVNRGLSQLRYDA